MRSAFAYKIHGKGQPLILTTGFASAQDMWYSQVCAFSKYYRIIAFDNRGFRESDKPAGPCTTKTLASDTIGLMDHLGIKKAHVLGGSMGGMAAQEIAIEHPEGLYRLIQSGTSTGSQLLQHMPFRLIEAITPEWNRSRPDLASPNLQNFMVAMASQLFNGAMYRVLVVPLVKMQARPEHREDPGRSA